MNAKQIFKKAVQYLSIKTELETFDEIHEELQKAIVFKGTNLWILVFAVVVASVGLNMNSTAVIIGAMLISPLMGPINGIGYSIATYNFTLLGKALKQFSFAVVISLLASTAYFLLTPISSAHSELLARTEPTIYDVIIALFGGLAGIVAISSKQKGNVIPGVAIATALMPPLCTAGYGLATHQFHFFFGAMYLFTINTVFIAIASMAISKVLKFPITSRVDQSKKKRVNRIVYSIIFLVFIPSIYLGYKLIEKEKFFENANKYISNVNTYEGNYLLKSEIEANNKIIYLTYGGTSLTENQKGLIVQMASDYNLKDPEVVIKQGLTFDGFDKKDKEVLTLRENFYNIDIALKAKQLQLDSISKNPYLGNALLAELRKFYPQIKNCTYAQSIQFSDTTDIPEKITFVVFHSVKNGLTKSDKEKVNEWVKTRLKEKKVKVIYE